MTEGRGWTAYLKNRDQIIYVRMIGHRSPENTKVMLARKTLKFEVVKLLEIHFGTLESFIVIFDNSAE